ncbi:MAG TPA: NAD(P)/FAD-dependent oxidoreductase [Acidobacteriota bacterium]|nr:NAD(P)/FAD-dependent oxidoreductase [Acidobacteriota bacterium]
MPSDIVVLGAGPAGIAISLLMAQRQYTVEIVDPATFPRKKICGEFLNPQAVRWLYQHGLHDLLLDLHPYPIYGMKISDADGVSFRGHYRSYRDISGYAVMREAFDTLLVGHARKAGVHIHEAHRAQRLIFDGSRVIGVAGVNSNGEPFEILGKVLIGADGRNNLIGRTFGWVRQIRNLRKYAFQTYYDQLPELSTYGEVHLVRGGYVGIAPLNERFANVALVVDEKEYPDGDTDPIAFLQERIDESHLSSRFRNLRAPSSIMNAGPLAYEAIQTSGCNTMLIGDTCGFIDPFTGEGINYAFTSADLAAQVLDRAFQTRNFDDTFLRTYDVERRKMFSRKHALNRLFQFAIPHPAISRMLIRRFSRNLGLADAMVSAVGSALPVDEVWNLRFLLRVLFA